MSKRFSEQSNLYARYRPDYPGEMYDFIFKHLSAKESAWDCATGSGQIAKQLAKEFDIVFATDISEEQLAHAVKKENILYRKAAAEDSGLPEDNYDLITVGQAIHWFNVDQFYEEVKRVAKSEALLAVIGYGMVRVNSEINPIIDQLYDKAFNTYFTKARSYLDNHYKSLPFPFEEIPAPSFEYSTQWSIDELEGYFNSWSAVQKMKTEENYNPATDTIKKIKRRISTEEKFDVSFPVFMRLGRIKK